MRPEGVCLHEQLRRDEDIPEGHAEPPDLRLQAPAGDMRRLFKKRRCFRGNGKSFGGLLYFPIREVSAGMREREAIL